MSVPRLLRNRYAQLALLVALPLALFLVLRERNSWRPQPLVHVGKTRRGSLSRIMYSPDGRFLVTENRWDYRAQLRDARTGALLHTLSEGEIAFSKDGRRLGASPGGMIRIRDGHSGKLLLEKKVWASGAIPQPLAYSLDGTRFAVGMGDSVWIWNTRAVHGPEHKLSSGLVNCDTFSPDGRLFAAGGWGQIKYWNVVSGKLLHTIKGPETWKLTFGPTAIAFSRDGSILAATSGWGDPTPVLLWDVGRGRLLHQLERGGAWLSFSPNGQMVASQGRIWDAHTGSLMRSLPEGIRFLCGDFSPDGKNLTTGNDDGTVWLWRIR